MDMMTLSNALVGTTNAALPAVKGGTGSMTVDGNGNPFSALLQALGLSLGTQGDAGQKNHSGLLEMLTALSGSLSPLTVNQTGQQGSATPTSDGLIEVMIGEQKLTLDLKDLPFSHEDMALLLQQFGLAPALVTVLLENPKGKLSLTLQDNPELGLELKSALTQMVQSMADQPSILLAANEKVAALMKEIFAQLKVAQPQTNAAAGEQTTEVAPQASAVFGKLQATLSTHTVRAAATMAESGSSDQLSNGQSAAQSAAAGIGAQPHLVTRTIVGEPAVVTMQGDQLAAELPDMIIKRASLLEAPGRHEFRIILEPAGLGEIEVIVQKIGDRISLQIAAENTASRALIDAGLQSLRAQFQAQGIQYDRIDVTAQSGNGQNDANSGLPQERGGQQQGQSGHSSGRPGGDSAAFSLDGLEAADTALEEATPADGLDVTA